MGARHRVTLQAALYTSDLCEWTTGAIDEAATMQKGVYSAFRDMRDHATSTDEHTGLSELATEMGKALCKLFERHANPREAAGVVQTMLRDLETCTTGGEKMETEKLSLQRELAGYLQSMGHVAEAEVIYQQQLTLLQRRVESVGERSLQTDLRQHALVTLLLSRLVGQSTSAVELAALLRAGLQSIRRMNHPGDYVLLSLAKD